MILDKLENAPLYFDCVPRFREFMDFFNANDLDIIPACKIKLFSDDLFVNIMDFSGKELEDCKMEGHRDYIDIQIPLTESEKMGWRAKNDCEIILSEYDESKDMEIFGDKAQTILTVPAGYFVVFFPTDAHQPGYAPGKHFRKLLVKTKVSE